MEEKDIRKWLKTARKKKKITQKQMSERLGISLSSYRELEKGPTRMINPNLRKACELLQTDLSSILTQPDRMTKKGPGKTYFQQLRELGDWRPEDRHVTSREEVRMLTEHFGMEEMDSLGLRNLRDMTVSYYTALLSDDDRKEQAMLAMMSVTAVIDHHTFKKQKR